MTLKEFITQYDKEGSVVLMEGKRIVLEAEQEKLTKLGELLAKRTKLMKFRSGNAAGSDHYFSLGVVSVDNKRLQVITPYTGHRKKTNQAYETVSLDNIDMASDHEIVYQSKIDKKNNKLIDRYVSGERDRFAIKAAYLIRDTVKAIGTDEIGPATFGLFYDDLENPLAGGTGHTMKVCKENDIPILNQEAWFKWLEE
jgi:hypothetical protein